LKRVSSLYLGILFYLNKFLSNYRFAFNAYGFVRNTDNIDRLIIDFHQNRENFIIAIKNLVLGDFKNIKTMQFFPDRLIFY
jgi:hypothetical protein